MQKAETITISSTTQKIHRKSSGPINIGKETNKSSIQQINPL